jgi:hypothetical protein
MTYLTTVQQASKNVKREAVQETTKDLLASESDIRAVEISFYDHEIYAGDRLIASINHDSDDFVTQRWVVMINGLEIYRSHTWAKCDSYIRWHFTQGTLPAIQEEVELATSENAVMVEIASECEKYEFEILDDGIYYNDTKLGSVGCTLGNWWVVRESCQSKRKVPCDSAPDAVWSLWAMETSASIDEMDYEELLDIPFEMLTNTQWNLIKGYKPVSEVEEFVAA